MLDITKILKSEIQKTLAAAYRALFADQDPHYLAIIETAADTAMCKIAMSNASYHNMEHTLYVTAAGVAILEGKNLETPLTSKQWTEAILSLLFHDIGFVRGLCTRDENGHYHTGVDDELIELKRGDTDASMMPYHVDRGQCFVTENYGQHEHLDIESIRQCIERTRFPIPVTPEYQITEDMPGLVRAADLIGQFADPRYLNKLNALYQEFEEQGTNKRIGYRTLQDMYEGYPVFFEKQVLPYIKEGLRFLDMTEDGKDIVKSMENNLKVARSLTATPWANTSS